VVCTFRHEEQEGTLLLEDYSLLHGLAGGRSSFLDRTPMWDMLSFCSAARAKLEGIAQGRGVRSGVL
jgi:hypothetical protein